MNQGALGGSLKRIINEGKGTQNDVVSLFNCSCNFVICGSCCVCIDKET
jgi:hypothetical protein